MVIEFSRKWLEHEGFQGFATFAQLAAGRIKEIPTKGGLYVVLREGTTEPSFRRMSKAGRFRGDPTESLPVLRAKWVSKAQVIYIGKGNKLRSRVRAFVGFGAGNNKARHWGGRYVWQLADARQLIVAWQPTPEDVVPREAEIDLLCRFRDIYGHWPFANLTK